MSPRRRALEPHGIAHPKKRAFLANYAVTGNISVACLAAGVHRRTYYDWSEHDEVFVAAARVAREEAADHLEEHARKWATEGIGTLKLVYEDGKLTRREESRDVSATLLIFLLKGLRPEKYRERVDLTQTHVVKTVDAETWDAV